jgi:hypothetical protein
MDCCAISALFGGLAGCLNNLPGIRSKNFCPPDWAQRFGVSDAGTNSGFLGSSGFETAAIKVVNYWDDATIKCPVENLNLHFACSIESFKALNIKGLLLAHHRIGHCLAN